MSQKQLNGKLVKYIQKTTEARVKAWEDPLSQVRCHTQSTYINHLLKALKDTFSFQPLKGTFDVPSGGQGVFTHKHLLNQLKVHISNLAATSHATYVHEYREMLTVFPIAIHAERTGSSLNECTLNSLLEAHKLKTCGKYTM